jgi:hypothetical protein
MTPTRTPVVAIFRLTGLRLSRQWFAGYFLQGLPIDLNDGQRDGFCA